MTLNIFFMTITIKKREMDPEEIMERERIRKITEENKNRQFSMYRPF
ncbi:YrzI family small protein [Neobacillus sp. YIM B06451]|nr:YrzI family small protein [Neobacillus sp. YIM B06451]